MNSLLNDFYHAWWDWAEAGAPEENEFGFESGVGLCTSLMDYCFSQSLDDNECYSANSAMLEQFVYYGLDENYPFNISDYDYEAEIDKTKNNLRTSFVWMNMVPKDKA